MKGFDVRALMDRGRALFSGFTTGQKAMTAIAVVAVLVGGAMFASWASKPTYAPLFTSLSAADAAAITTKLADAKEPYQLADGGQTVLVPQADVYQQRIDLSGAGLPAGTDGSGGYSLLDKQSLTTSDFQQKVTYQRALEGELQKTIEAVDGVDTAVVHLALPADTVFVDNAATPTASVLVKTAPGATLQPGQVQAIVHLVSSAVPNLSPDQVTVADGTGQMLSAAGDAGTSAVTDIQSQQTQAFENSTAGSVQTMLDKLVGPGHAVVRVDATLNYDKQTVDRQEYVTPKKVIPLTESTTKETYKGGGTPVGGVLGPDNTAVPQGASGGKSNYVKSSNDRSNALGTVKTSTTAAPGAVRRMSVAVLLDQSVTKVPQSQIRSLVAAAAGVDPKRGDVVNVSAMPFDTTAATAAQQELAKAASAKRTAQLIKTAEIAGLLLLLGLALLLGVRRSRRVERTAVDIGELSVYTEDQAAIEAGRTTAFDPAVRSVEFDVPPPSPAGALADSQTVARKEIGQLIEQQPDEVARLLRGWLAERSS